MISHYELAELRYKFCDLLEFIEDYLNECTSGMPDSQRMQDRAEKLYYDGKDYLENAQRNP